MLRSLALFQLSLCNGDLNAFYVLRRDGASAIYEYRRMPKHPQSLFGKRLRAARERLCLPQDKLGVAIGIDEGSCSARISRYETGAHEPPFGTAERLAAILKVPVTYFYCREDSMAELLLEISDFATSEIQLLRKAARRIVHKRQDEVKAV